MVKNTKYILFRIIIGVGIALVFGFLSNMLVVNAAPINIAPSQLCGINNTSDTCSVANVNSYQVYDRTFYGNSFGASVTRGRIVWFFSSNNNIKEKTYDLDFILYIQGSSSYLDSTRGYIQNSANNIFSCEIDNTRYAEIFNGNSGSTGAPADGSAVVHCSNVYLSNNDFRFYLMDITTRSQGVIAISSVTLTETNTQAIKSEIESVNDNITDDSVDEDNASSSITSMQGEVATNGSITQLLTLPITLYQAVLNSISGSCSAWNLGSLFNHNITLPCINLQSLLGSTIWGVIDILCSGLFILSFRKKLVDIFNHMTSLNDRGNELE